MQDMLYCQYFRHYWLIEVAISYQGANKWRDFGITTICKIFRQGGEKELLSKFQKICYTFCSAWIGKSRPSPPLDLPIQREQYVLKNFSEICLIT